MFVKWSTKENNNDNNSNNNNNNNKIELHYMKEKITSPSRKKASMKMMDLRCRDCNGIFSWCLILLRKMGDFRESRFKLNV